VLAVTVKKRWRTWATRLFSVSGIFFGNLASWFSGGALSDPHGIAQTAVILHEIKLNQLKHIPGD